MASELLLGSPGGAAQRPDPQPDCDIGGGRRPRPAGRRRTIPRRGDRPCLRLGRRWLGLHPREAVLSYSTFGDPKGVIPGSIREAVKLLDKTGVDFEHDGEMAADVALNPALRETLYPFCRLTGPANVLIMPGLYAAHILTRAIPQLTSATVIGPLLLGLSRPAQIVPMQAGVNQVLDVACLAAHAAIAR
ncbi:MAG: phosphate acyltransferase [Pseudomonadota bacterium]